MSRRIVGLDIGTCFIRTVIAEVDSENNIEILGFAKCPSQGVRNGIIVNIDDTKNAVCLAIETAENYAGIDVDSVADIVVSVGGNTVSSINNEGSVAVDEKGKNNNRRTEIRMSAKNRVLESAKTILLPYDEDLLHILPQQYLVDDIEYPDPVGVLGVQLKVKALLIKISRTTSSNIRECLTRAGYSIGGITLKTLAAANATIRKEDMELGSILIDLGGGSTDVIVLNKGAAVYTATIPSGGNRITNDIATVMGVPFSVAEKIKLESGCCWLDADEAKEEVIIPGNGNLAPVVTTKGILAEIISARMEDILMAAKREVVRHSGLTKLNGTIVLTGGGALMPGVVTLAQSVWNSSSVGLGTCRDFGGQNMDYRNPDYATAVGLVVTKGSSETKSAFRTSEKKTAGEPKHSGLGTWFSGFMKKIN
ncbi:MAG: cell division protein FtsA [Treponema sp.]|nr:cell division protein FtsA [Treponema sp.]